MSTIESQQARNTDSRPPTGLLVPTRTEGYPSDYPELTEEDIRACLSYAADRERTNCWSFLRDLYSLNRAFLKCLSRSSRSRPWPDQRHPPAEPAHDQSTSRYPRTSPATISSFCHRFLSGRSCWCPDTFPQPLARTASTLTYLSIGSSASNSIYFRISISPREPPRLAWENRSIRSRHIRKIRILRYDHKAVIFGMLPNDAIVGSVETELPYRFGVWEQIREQSAEFEAEILVEPQLHSAIRTPRSGSAAYDKQARMSSSVSSG